MTTYVERLPCIHDSAGRCLMWLAVYHRGSGGSAASNGRPMPPGGSKVKDFIIAGVAEKDGQWFALGTYDGRFMSLPISDEEANEAQPHLAEDKTYRLTVEEDRAVRDGELLVTAGSPEAVTA